MAEYELRVDGKPMRFYTELCRDLLNDWREECVKYPDAEKQVEIVQVKETVIFSQYHFHQFKKMFDRMRHKDSCKLITHPSMRSVCTCGVDV